MARAQVRRPPGQPPLRSEAALDALDKGFSAAAARVGGPVDHWYGLAGATLRVRFAGPALLSHLPPALDGLALPPVEHPDLTACAWDTASTGVALAPSTIVQLRGASDAALEWPVRCLARLPCYRLDLGREPAAMAEAVREVLARC